MLQGDDNHWGDDMMDVDITQLVPEFLLEDRQGRAMAKALETGLRRCCEIIRQGTDIVLDTDKMPMWRLDEMAWELGCLYSYEETDIEKKRGWVRRARELYGKYGTTEAIYQYLADYFPKAFVEENWEYGGEPYHFRVTLEGGLDEKREKWARNTIEQVKNLRSVLEGFAVGCDTGIVVRSRGQAYPMRAPKAGQKKAGQWPRTHAVGGAGRAGMTARGQTESAAYYAPITGTEPGPAYTMGEGQAGASTRGTGEGTRYPFPQTGEETAGQVPDTATVGVAREGGIRKTEAAEEATIYYPLAGVNLCGE